MIERIDTGLRKPTPFCSAGAPTRTSPNCGRRRAVPPPLATYLDSTPKYVVTNTLETLEWRNSHLAHRSARTPAETA